MGLNWWPGSTLPWVECLKIAQKAEDQRRFVGTAEESGVSRSLWTKAVRKEWMPASFPGRFLAAAVEVGKKCLGLWTDE